MFTPSDFRQQFPEFRDPEVYSDPILDFWSGIASSLLNADRWGALLDYGISLFIAHHLVLGQRDVQADEVGGLPGIVNGPQTAKSVDKVAASYDTSAVSLTDAGFWNSSMYGIRFLQMARLMGAGGLQL